MEDVSIPNQNLSKRGLPKIIFIILALILVGEAIFAVRTLLLPIPNTSPLPKAQVVSTIAKISLISDKSTYNVGEAVPVQIQVDTGGRKIVGNDAVIHFDPTILMATGSAAITKGSALKDYPFLEVDSKLGMVTVAGISSIEESYLGKFILATINFKAKAVGTTAVTITYTPGDTTDTNLVEAGTNKDILEKVENLNLTIK